MIEIPIWLAVLGALSLAVQTLSVAAVIVVMREVLE